ncbi:MAG TPA: alpha/beta fold hydrolase [Nocardioidaceae bacterium]|nr:alpha/beta fold hydrolase [Nocardioidaceae bacterium]
MTSSNPERTPAPARTPRDERGNGAGVAGAAALAIEYAEQLVLGAVRDVHQAVADRVFATTDCATGGSSRLPRQVHDGVSAAIYGGLGAAMTGGVTALRKVDRRGVGPRLEQGPVGRHLVSAVNGLIGDRLSEERPELAIEMAVRCDGRDVMLDPDALAAAFPDATGDLVVFLHGLGENDDSWNLRRAERGGTYGSRLRKETSWTPLFLRANTGLPIAENGAALSALLDRLVVAWPTRVRRIALVGHSMGGLIMRAACAVAPEGIGSTDPWTDRVSDVVTLGTPHLGAPLERVVHAGSRVLGILPESAPFGRILEYRSVGILDLRRGLAGDVRHLPHARYHLVAATLTGSRRHPVSEVFGDLLVRYSSAVATPRRGSAMFPDADILHVPGTDHFGLLNHPDVYTALKGWLGDTET